MFWGGECRVSDLCADNNMPPSNLGIVFGPTLLRRSEGGVSLSSLVDTVHQAKVVELLILHNNVRDVNFIVKKYC